MQRAAGMLLVVALHGLVLYWAWQQVWLAELAPEQTVFVEFLAPPLQVPPPVQPRRQRVKLAPAQPEPIKPAPVLTSAAPQASETAPVVPVVEKVVEAVVPVKPVGPVTLAGDLALSCPERPAPTYPALSRRLGEEGRVVVRVELDAQGRVENARVATGSGVARLDAAALAAVRTWRCNPARRDGQAVRAVAL